MRRIRRHPAVRATRKWIRKYRAPNRFFRRASRFAPYLGVEVDGVAYILSTADRNVGRSLVVKRERKELRHLASALALLERTNATAGRRLFLDIGANIGTTVLPAIVAHGFERAIAFEPDPANFRLLRANLAINALEERVTAFPLALSDANGEAELATSTSNSGDYWLKRHPQDASGTAELVRTARLDDVLAEAGVEADAIGLVWMDVEGHEPHVLTGAPAILDRSVPLVLEFCPRHLERSDGLALLLDQLGSTYSHVYDLRRPEAPPFTPETLETLAERYSTSFTDLLALRASAP